ncbi:phosphopyruvate hydratase [Candidatus Kaiserbacteria bacterium]|nr:phosphopyruvate hydratase [Candidatus Kaiserbacteria bacterium]
MRIDRLEAKQVLDSRGKPTVEVSLSANTFTATASAPSGKSTGNHEAFELRDPDGSVTRAIENVNGEIARETVGRRFSTLDDLDTFLIELDGTSNKARLGANALLAVSIAGERLFALLADVPLWQAIAERAGTKPAAPRLFVNVLNGGVHVSPAAASAKAGDFSLDKLGTGKLPFQEYMLVIEGKTSEAFPLAQELFAKLGERLGPGAPMGDEGGYSPTFDSLEEPFEILAALIQGHSNVSLALDAAASELLHDDHYELLGKSYSAEELAAIYRRIATEFPMHSIEDPFAEDMFEDFASLAVSLGNTLVVGDDLTVTNPERIKTAVARGAISAVIIKPNQIGTIKEALAAVRETRAAGFEAVASHRSGETRDTFIADFAYGIGAHGLKAGGLGQRERLEKYERLLAIEREAAGI